MNHIIRSFERQLIFIIRIKGTYLDINLKTKCNMASSKSTYSKPKITTAGKGSASEVKTNEDFNKIKPLKDDPQFKVKKIKK